MYEALRADEAADYFPLPEAGLWTGAVSLKGELQLEELPHEPGVAGRVGNVLGTALTELKDSDQKIRTTAGGVGAMAVWAVGAARLPFLLAPEVTVDVLRDTHSAIEAGLTTGTMFGVWYLTVGETVNYAMSRYSRAVKAVGDNFPSFVKHFGNSLAGIEASLAGGEDDSSRRAFLARHVGGKALLTHARRGLTAVGIGIIPYTLTAGIKGQSRDTVRKLGRALGLDGGFMIGLMSGGLAELIIKVGHDDPESIRRVQEYANNTKLWYGVAGGLMAAEWLNNKRKDRQTSDPA